MCKYHYGIIQKVFINPDDVMYKFVFNIYHLKLNKYVQTMLDERKNENRYLDTLYDLYTRTAKLSQELSQYNKSNDEFDIVSKLSQKIFKPHLSTYIETEAKVLDQKCAIELKKFYESKNHQKKKAERFQDFKRDVQANVQALIGTRGANLAQLDEGTTETFLSEELAINLLQESKLAFKRCRVVSCRRHSRSDPCGKKACIENSFRLFPVDVRERPARQYIPFGGYLIAISDARSRRLCAEPGPECDSGGGLQGAATTALLRRGSEDKHDRASFGKDIQCQHHAMCCVRT